MKKKRKLSPIRAGGRILPLLLKHCPILVAIYSILTLLIAILSALTAYCNQFFYDSLLNSVYEKQSLLRPIFGALMVLFVMLFEQLLGKLYGFVWVHLGDKIEYSLIYEYTKKISRCSAISFEDPAFLEDLSKASDGIYGSIGMFATICEIVLYFGGYFIVTGIYLWNVSPILLIILLLIFIPTALTILLQSRMYADEADEVIPLRRKLDSYYSATLNHRETRLFGAFNFFYNLVYTTQEEIHAINRKTEKKNCSLTLFLNMTKFVGWCSVLILMVIELINGHITIGAFAAVYQSLNNMFSNCEALFGRLKSDVSENLGMIEDYIDFIDMPSKQYSSANVDYREGITIHNVSFSYPTTNTKVLDNISFSIASGETIAIVGNNGSGKTTLAKLLCGLYTPDEGAIYIGGADSSLTTPEILFTNTSAVFQNYVRYNALSLKENVLISDTLNPKNVAFYMRLAGCADYLMHPKKFDSLMSREFNGIELSGGEWQRIAMARGLYRDHDFILLDEPTAAIDPIEETRIYKMFASIAEEKTCILITHRLGSARIADRIIVMDEGHIIEIGTHHELLQKKGLYHKMWTSASEQYFM